MRTPSLSSRPTRAGSFLDVRSPSATTRPHASPTYDHDCRVKSLRLDAFATRGSTVALPLQPRETFCAVRRSWRASSWRRALDLPFHRSWPSGARCCISCPDGFVPFRAKPDT